MICPHCNKNSISRIRYILKGGVGILGCPSCDGKSKIDNKWKKEDKKEKLLWMAYFSTICVISLLCMKFISFKSALLTMIVFSTLPTVFYHPRLIQIDENEKESKRAKAFHIFIILGYLCTAFLLWLLRPDIRPVDDSALNVVVPHTPASENGFMMLCSGVSNYRKGACRTSFQGIYQGHPISDSEKSEDLSQNCDPIIQLTKRAVDSPEFYVPERKTDNSQISESCFRYLKDYSDIQMMIITNDLRANRIGAALSRVDDMFKVATALKRSHGGLTLYVIGNKSKNRAIEASNNMLNSNILSPELQTAYIRKLDGYRESPKEIQDAFAVDYQHFKIFLKKDKDLKKFAGDFMIYKPNMTIRNEFQKFSSYASFAGKPYSEMKFKKTDKTPSIVGMMFRAILSGNIIGDVFREIGSYDNMCDFFMSRSVFSDVLLNAVRLKMASSLYHKHNGKLPNSLSDLVPDFIDKLPIDPFDGKPMRYNAHRGIVYSIGLNLKDDGGAARRKLFDGKYSQVITEKDLVLEIFPNQKNSK